MFGFRQSPSPAPASAPANSKAFSPYHVASDQKLPITPARRTYSEPAPLKPNRTNPFDDDDGGDEERGGRPAFLSRTRTALKPNRTNPFDDDDDGDEENGGRPAYLSRTRTADKTTRFDSMSVQEMEGYAVNRSEETTNSVNSCLRIAEDIRQDATKTLETLHQQGEQITRTHIRAVDMERDLSRGEKLLSSLGGMFSKRWKPKWTREITGPLTSNDNIRSPASKEQRENLIRAPAFNCRSRAPPVEPANAMQKIEIERAKQDDALSDLSNLLGELKFMATDMGSEINRQNKALEHVSDDVDELNTRIQGANRRAHHLLRK